MKYRDEYDCPEDAPLSFKGWCIVVLATLAAYAVVGGAVFGLLWLLRVA